LRHGLRSLRIIRCGWPSGSRLTGLCAWTRAQVVERSSAASPEPQPLTQPSDCRYLCPGNRTHCIGHRGCPVSPAADQHAIQPSATIPRATLTRNQNTFCIGFAAMSFRNSRQRIANVAGLLIRMVIRDWRATPCNYTAGWRSEPRIRVQGATSRGNGANGGTALALRFSAWWGHLVVRSINRSFDRVRLGLATAIV